MLLLWCENWALAMDTGVSVAKIYCYWALIAFLWPAVQMKCEKAHFPPIIDNVHKIRNPCWILKCHNCWCGLSTFAGDNSIDNESRWRYCTDYIVCGQSPLQWYFGAAISYLVLGRGVTWKCGTCKNRRTFIEIHLLTSIFRQTKPHTRRPIRVLVSPRSSTCRNLF